MQKKNSVYQASYQAIVLLLGIGSVALAASGCGIPSDTSGSSTGETLSIVDPQYGQSWGKLTIPSNDRSKATLSLDPEASDFVVQEIDAYAYDEDEVTLVGVFHGDAMLGRIELFFQYDSNSNFASIRPRTVNLPLPQGFNAGQLEIVLLDLEDGSEIELLGVIQAGPGSPNPGLL